jgi:hypothetical protein
MGRVGVRGTDAVRCPRDREKGRELSLHLVCLVKKVVSSDAETGKQDAQKNMERDEKYFLVQKETLRLCRRTPGV